MAEATGTVTGTAGPGPAVGEVPGWDGPVVVGVDDSAHARRAVAWAAEEAVRAGAPLRLVAVSGLAGEHLPGRAGRRRALDRALDRARAVAEEVLAGAAGADGADGAGGPSGATVAVETAVRSGTPVPVLAEESGRARLVVLGDRGAGRVEGLLAGSVAMGLIGRAECPVVVVRGASSTGPPWSPDRITDRPVVVGVDGTPASAAAAAFALRAAADRGVALLAVHADPDRPPGPDGPACGRETAEVREHLAPERRGAALANPQGVPVRMVFAPGRAARLLLAASHRARLVVVGSRGRGELAGLLRGSVGSVLVHRAGCPVVVLGPRCRPGPVVGTNVPITRAPGHCPQAGPSGSVGATEVEER
ncbi:MAG: universal stress protein [Pseudonocardiales bacterium]|nr:universal stress protein [Pseudonocardiales bacterium]